MKILNVLWPAKQKRGSLSLTHVGHMVTLSQAYDSHKAILDFFGKPQGHPVIGHAQDSLRVARTTLYTSVLVVALSRKVEEKAQKITLRNDCRAARQAMEKHGCQLAKVLYDRVMLAEKLKL